MSWIDWSRCSALLKSKNYIKQFKLIAEDLNKKDKNGVYWANQFDNIVNTEAHIKTTAEEIWVEIQDQ